MVISFMIFTFFVKNKLYSYIYMERVFINISKIITLVNYDSMSKNDLFYKIKYNNIEKKSEIYRNQNIVNDSCEFIFPFCRDINWLEIKLFEYDGVLGNKLISTTKIYFENKMQLFTKNNIEGLIGKIKINAQDEIKIIQDSNKRLNNELLFMKSYIEQIKKTIKNLDKEIIKQKKNINNDLEGIIGKTKTILYLLNEDR